MRRNYLSLPQIGLFVLIALLTLSACERTEQGLEPARAGRGRIRVNQTITEVVVNSPNFTLLEAAVIKAGLANALASGNLTVFAPTDAAFQAAGFADVNAINNADVNTLSRILLYHVIGTERFFEDRIPEHLAGFTTLQGGQVYANRRGGLTVNGIKVSQADLETNNGVIHVIDRVLIPPTGNTVEVAVANPNLSFLVAALQRASQGEVNLVQALASGSFTVFAPTNAAFQAAGFANVAAIQAADPNVLSGVLRYHVLRERTFSTQLNDQDLVTLQGGMLTATKTPTKASIKGLGNATPSQVQVADLVTLNGVVHVIDQVLLPGSDVAMKSITGIVVDSPDFTLLEAAVIKAGLANALTSGNLTVFAPTDAAFQAAGFADVNAINNVDVNTLRKILLYHVIGSERYFVNRLPERLAGFTTLEGGQVQVIRRQGVSVNGIFVTQADVKATNGVIHVIDKVLSPPAGNIAEVAAANPNMSFLVAAIQRAGLTQTIATGGPFTVFAPTNAAFQAAGFADVAAIQAADPAVLTKILTYHVVNDRAFSSTLQSGEISTLQGSAALISVGPNQSITVKGNGNASPSRVVAADVVTLNGVVHVIDQVLLP